METEYDKWKTTVPESEECIYDDCYDGKIIIKTKDGKEKVRFCSHPSHLKMSKDELKAYHSGVDSSNDI
jgi:hypothetical protein